MTMYLVDTSAAARIGNQQVRHALEHLVGMGVVATCVTLDLEAGFSAQSPDEVNAVFNNRANQLTRLAITEPIADRARQVMQRLATHGLHRSAGPMDLLTAAVAEHYRAIVLHYDTDFDHIASVTGQQTQWVVPRGSID